MASPVLPLWRQNEQQAAVFVVSRENAGGEAPAAVGTDEHWHANRLVARNSPLRAWNPGVPVATGPCRASRKDERSRPELRGRGVRIHGRWRRAPVASA